MSALLLGAVSPDAQVSKAVKSGKKGHESCSMCHADKEYRDFATARSKVNGTCLDCHPNSTKKDHPIGRVVYVASDKLPLDEEKRLTCVTCHEPHGKDTVEKLLRMDFNSLCIVCHKF